MIYNVPAYKVLNKKVFLQSNYTFQEMLLNTRFFYFSYFLFISPKSVKKFSLQIYILSDLEDCTVAWNIQLHSLEPQAVPKARRMYFFRTCDNREQCCTSN